MNRKHFEALAAVIAENYTRAINADDAVARDTVARLAGGIARVCADHNPDFDDRRFLNACGISPGRMATVQDDDRSSNRQPANT